MSYPAVYRQQEVEEDDQGLLTNCFGIASDSDDEGGGEAIQITGQLLPPTITGMFVATLIRDAHKLSTGGISAWHAILKVGRFNVAFWAYLFVMFLQIFVVVEMKILVTPMYVSSIRSTYDAFESVMYTDASGVAHTYNTVNGFARGIGGHLDEQNFNLLSADVQAEACRIPLSQPMYLFVILLLWTLTCFDNIRGIGSTIMRVLWFSTPCVDSMADALQTVKDDPNARNVVGLTCTFKILITITLCGPLLVAILLLWLGSRWLLATVGFDILLLNSVALEFILLLPELIYTAIVPLRTRYEVENTYINPVTPEEHRNFFSYFGTFGFGILAIAYALLYMFVFQQVLPDYNWDVHEVCETFLEKIRSGMAG
uniref:Uncharacterized protein n=1 Tax=Noctiluca scintillans TaxID=2966 RepID=A0A7S1F819_NOCSC